MTSTQRGTFIKLALRRAQAISVINVAVILDIEVDAVRSASTTLGAVTPIIIHAAEAEACLTGKGLTDEVIDEAARLAMNASKPIDDIRGSAAYRREMVRVCTRRGLRSLRDGQERRDAGRGGPVVGGREQRKRNPVTAQDSVNSH